MADNIKIDAITSMDDDFAQWYTDIVKKAELADYSGVRGCMIIRPYGYAIWENIKDTLDRAFKRTGHQNVAMPMFIPESLLNKEKDHVEGFAPEVAWVTHGGQEKLTERLCVRPTSETLFCDHYANIIKSYRDLPKLYNQWCSVVRWEKTTRPFLRTVEFFWQEGHTIHETADEAKAETLQMLNIYADFLESTLAIPVIKGQKTNKEKFAGAVATYTVEAMMHDGKALQSGTSHYFGDGFAKAFDIQFTSRDNTLRHPHQTSWGMATRVIGAIIMCHGDNNGLILPPNIAPIQVMIVPVAQHKGGVLEKAYELKSQLEGHFRVSIDDSDNSPGYKYAEQEMKGIPVRLEIGPRDIENGSCVLVRRDTGEKTQAPIDGIAQSLQELLANIQDNLYSRALENRKARTYSANTLDELIKTANEKAGFIKASWCGDRACEDKLKAEAGVTSRCIPFGEEMTNTQCVCCGKTAKNLVYWGKAY